MQSAGAIKEVSNKIEEVPSVSEYQPLVRDEANGKWNDVLEIIKVERFPLFTILKESKLTSVSDDIFKIYLKQDFQFFKEKLKEESNQTFLHQVCLKVWGKAVRIVLEEQYSPVIKPSKNPLKSPSKASTINHIIALFDGTTVAM